MRPKGHPKTGGRVKGSQNVICANIREHFSDLVEMNMLKLQSDINSLEPLARIKVIIELAKFLLPTLKSMEIDANVVESKFNPIEVTIIGEEEFKEISNKLEAKY